jgi:hypothetical protein
MFALSIISPINGGSPPVVYTPSLSRGAPLSLSFSPSLVREIVLRIEQTHVQFFRCCCSACHLLLPVHTLSCGRMQRCDDCCTPSKWQGAFRQVRRQMPSPLLSFRRS